MNVGRSIESPPRCIVSASTDLLLSYYRNLFYWCENFFLSYKFYIGLP